MTTTVRIPVDVSYNIKLLTTGIIQDIARDLFKKVATGKGHSCAGHVRDERFPVLTTGRGGNTPQLWYRVKDSFGIRYSFLIAVPMPDP